MLNKKGVSPVVAIALLLITAVVAVVGFGTWFSSFSSGVYSNTESQSTDSVGFSGIDTVINGAVYLKNSFDTDMIVNSIKVEGVDCNVTGTISANSFESIPLGTCLNNLEGEIEVTVFTDKKIYSKYYYVTLYDSFTGFFIDSKVSGVWYNTSSGLNGITGSEGQFEYKFNDSITFGIGNTTLGSAPGNNYITVVDIVPGGNLTSQRVLNIAKLLITLDSDFNPDNGITITQNARSNLGIVNLDVSTSSFESTNNALIYNLTGTLLVNDSYAQNHLNNSILEISGIQAENSGNFPSSAGSPVLSFSSNSTNISYGSSISLSWSGTNSNSCTASGDWNGAKNISDSETINNITSDINLTLSCNGFGGNTSSNVFVNVGPLIINVTTDTIELNLFSLAGSPASATDVILIIDSGVYIYGDNTPEPSIPAFDTGTFPVGSTIEIRNYGFIAGPRVAGKQDTNPSSPIYGNNQAWYGGDAMVINSPATIINYGEIIGGQGGAGRNEGDACGNCGGGNGGSSGGAGGTAIVFNANANITNHKWIYGAGGGGAGGAGGWACGYGSGAGGWPAGGGYLNTIKYTADAGTSTGGCSGNGGAGGTFGQSGANGGAAYNSGGTGGAGGYAFELNGNTILYNGSTVVTNSAYTEGTWLNGTKGRIS